MKSIPLKRTRNIRWLDQLRVSCRVNYGEASLNDIDEYLVQFDTLRQSISGISVNEANEASVLSLMRYVGLLTLLESKFSVQTDAAWSESYKPGEFTFSKSLAIEKASALYNLAALYSLLGCHSNRSESSGLKDALKYFQLAAGIFTYLRDSVSLPSKCIARDLKDPILSMNVALLLAQAQSCFYEKAVKEKYGRSLLSKLSCGVSSLYASAYNLGLQVQNPSLDPAIVGWYSIQSFAFLSAAHYQRAMADNVEVSRVSKGYGTLISRLREAVRLSQLAEKQSKDLNLIVNLEQLKSSCSTWLAELEKDNKIIYVESVPSISECPPLETTTNVKAETLPPFSEWIERKEEAVKAFDRLVPPVVRSKIDDLQLEVAKTVNRLQTDMTVELQAARTDLGKRGLPFSVREDVPDLPIDLWEKIHSIQVKGGIKSLESLLDSLVASASIEKQKLLDLKRRLEEELSQDDSCRHKFGPSWSPLPSSTLNRWFWDNIATYEEKLQLAVEANEKVKGKFSSSSPFHRYLLMSREEVTRALPTNDSWRKEDEEKRAKVISALDNLEECQVGLQSSLQDCKASLQSYLEELTSQLLVAHQKNLPLSHIVEEGKQKIETWELVGIENSVAARRSVILAADSLPSTSSTVNTPPRFQFLQNLEVTCSTVLDALKEANEGSAFFSQLSEHIRSLSQQIEDWLFARREERTTHLSGLQYSLANLRLSDR